MYLTSTQFCFLTFICAKAADAWRLARRTPKAVAGLLSTAEVALLNADDILNIRYGD